jgi:hypothetical protein
MHKHEPIITIRIFVTNSNESIIIYDNVCLEFFVRATAIKDFLSTNVQIQILIRLFIFNIFFLVVRKKTLF